MRGFFSLLNGPQTFGCGRGFWCAAVAIFLVALAFPLVGDSYTVGNLAYFGVWVFMALGLSLIWGYGGMLSFGQTAFFGLRLQLRRHRHQSWRELRLSRAGTVLRTRYLGRTGAR